MSRRWNDIDTFSVRERCQNINKVFCEIGSHFGWTIDLLNVGILSNDSTGDKVSVARSRIARNFDRVASTLDIRLRSIPVISDSDSLSLFARVICATEANFELINVEIERLQKNIS